jgi:hypothetical protein
LKRSWSREVAGKSFEFRRNSLFIETNLF